MDYMNVHYYKKQSGGYKYTRYVLWENGEVQEKESYILPAEDVYDDAGVNGPYPGALPPNSLAVAHVDMFQDVVQENPNIDTFIKNIQEDYLGVVISRMKKEEQAGLKNIYESTKATVDAWEDVPGAKAASKAYDAVGGVMDDIAKGIGVTVDTVKTIAIAGAAIVGGIVVLKVIKIKK